MILGTIAGLSCEEELPPYHDPSDIVEFHLESKYAYSNTQNELQVDYVFTNLFDETLQAKAGVHGTGKITLRRDTSRHKTFTITGSDAVNGYNPLTGVVTIDPGKSIRFRYKWNFIDDDNHDLRKTAFIYYPDTTCTNWGRMIAFNETFRVTGSLKVFERIPMMTAEPGDLSMCHVNIFVLQNYCPIIDPTKPCP
jgi:hypothetical protein